MADQAGKLRALRARHKPVRTIAFTSGKGGVGKSTLVVNIGLVLARQGVRVGILDGDFGLANIDVLLGLTPKHTLRDVIEGEMELHEIVMPGPYGLQILPASSGIESLANLEAAERDRLIRKLSSLDELVDVLLVDTAAGISSTVLGLVLSCQEAVVVTMPEPTALTDAYALLKVVSQRNPRYPTRLLVNMAEHQRQAEETYIRIERVATRFLFSRPSFAGYVVWDPCVSKAVQEQKPLTVYYPYAKATKCIHTLAQSLLALPPASDGMGGFWGKMATWAGAR